MEWRASRASDALLQAVAAGKVLKIVVAVVTVEGVGRGWCTGGGATVRLASSACALRVPLVGRCTDGLMYRTV